MLSHVNPAGGEIELTVNCSCLGNGEEGGKKERVRREEEDLACFSFGTACGLSGLERFHRGAPVSAAPS